MKIGYRVFGTNRVQPDPAAVLRHLRDQGIDVEARFAGDDQGWFRIAFSAIEPKVSLQVDRFLTEEEGIRDNLNSWAAYLETLESNAHRLRLMQHVISSTQVFTLEWARQGGSGLMEALCLTLCRYLARETAGVYQVDGQGFFDADGTLLAEE